MIRRRIWMMPDAHDYDDDISCLHTTFTPRLHAVVLLTSYHGDDDVVLLMMRLILYHVL